MDSDSCKSPDSLSPARPFLKWAGGKSQLIAELKSRFPAKYKRYFEPFIGGGALFFNISPSGAYLSDVNEELINCYTLIRDDLQSLIRELKKYHYDQDLFYKIRDADRQADYKTWSAVQRAARLIFLNKTCFNGLYRVNSKGQFNVPFGRYSDPKILDQDNLSACSRVLKNTQISCASFLAVEDKVQAGDFVYFDPPYAPLSPTSDFTGYAKDGFGVKEQTELRDLCRRLDQKKVFWMVSNSSAPIILDLYNEFNISLISASRAINSKAANRGKIKEVIATNFNS